MSIDKDNSKGSGLPILSAFWCIDVVLRRKFFPSMRFGGTELSRDLVAEVPRH